jgi:RNA polymerase sigma-70 factor (ECF subfamily)
VSLSLGSLDEDPQDGGEACLPADPAAAVDLTALYRSQRARLLRFFHRRTSDPLEAQDLVQETFARVIGAGAPPELRKPEAYLTRVAQNLLRDRAKIRSRRSASAHVPADETILAGTDQNCLLEARDLLDRLERAMLELPSETREIFMAHRLDGMTYAEIAERTGLSIKQVERAISRALVELDRALGQR